MRTGYSLRAYASVKWWAEAANLLGWYSPLLQPQLCHAALFYIAVRQTTWTIHWQIAGLLLTYAACCSALDLPWLLEDPKRQAKVVFQQLLGLHNDVKVPWAPMLRQCMAHRWIGRSFCLIKNAANPWNLVLSCGACFTVAEFAVHQAKLRPLLPRQQFALSGLPLMTSQHTGIQRCLARQRERAKRFETGAMRRIIGRTEEA